MANATEPATSRWGALAGFVLVASANQMLWLNFTPITTGVSKSLGVSQSAIGWLSEIFPLLYVVLAVPVGKALDRWFRPTLLVGAGLTAVGAVLRCIDQRYTVILAGQVLIAVGQPAVLNAITGVSSRYLSADHRPVGIAIGSAGTFLGFVAAFVLGAIFGSSGLSSILVIGAVYSVVAAVVLAASMRGVAPTALTATDSEVTSRAVRVLWSDRVLRTLAGLVFVGFGAFVALSTWLETLLKPAGVLSGTTDTLLTFMVVAGVAGCALLPPVAASRDWEAVLLAGSAVALVASCLLLAAVPGVVTAGISLPVLGLLLLPALPVVLELAERRAGSAGGAATAVLWLAGNAGGIVVALIVQALQTRPAAAFVALALTGATALPLTVTLGRQLRGERTADHIDMGHATAVPLRGQHDEYRVSDRVAGQSAPPGSRGLVDDSGP